MIVLLIEKGIGRKQWAVVNLATSDGPNHGDILTRSVGEGSATSLADASG